ncbi:BZ3500_MvSof-1268-A1-R1_Chr12-3g04049 [Microbotryum saponariae]|uniref:BZ3500_MvSof-1268-A1-R1_Chr12-3g04049 protein n=1 Tax=Microbotryum saponariae TaxID=289078 RepID=A0A2X0KLS5_9BASI|nr:BZ3500_MvSof-1268-A1-R1_Chr12-3g04049 [Microbotryum saponariae]SDA02603.1 BZ3501_MvSof-1269-A2-R1_Chr12-3g03704 [Microbotryum saponariae]
MIAVDLARTRASVLLTGASGFLAAHVGQQLLQRGFRVRGTVRSQAKGEYLKKLYEKDGKADRFDFVIVEDVEQEGAFDEAVKGVDAVAYTASPFHFNVTDPQKDLINPAVQGTLNLVRSALLEPKIKRVVITSSFAAVTNPYDPVYTFTEEDWNEFSPKELEKKGKDCDPFHSYRASKTLAEKAAWDFLKENTKDGKAPFDIATINPPLIFGPVIHEIHSAKSLNTSVGVFYSYLLGDKTSEDATKPAGLLVDVRDVALAHVLALEKEEAGNKRFLVSKKEFVYQDILDLLEGSEQGKKLLSEFPKATKSGKGDVKGVKQNLIDTTRMETVLGLKARSVEETVLDMTRSLAERQKEW